MKSKDPKKLPPGRYTAAHLEKLQKLHLYARFCDLAGIAPVPADQVTILDTEIELKARIRRNCIVDLVRDGHLIPPEVIIPRGDKHYTISDRCMDSIEVDPDEVQGCLELGICFNRSMVDDVPLSRLMGFWNLLSEGTGVFEKYEVGGVWFYRVVFDPRIGADEDSSTEKSTDSEKISGDGPLIDGFSQETRGVRDPLEPDSSELSSE